MDISGKPVCLPVIIFYYTLTGCAAQNIRTVLGVIGRVVRKFQYQALFVPSQLLADTQPDRPLADRTELLALAADGSVAAVEIGRNSFGYRLPGVPVGVLAMLLL